MDTNSTWSTSILICAQHLVFSSVVRKEYLHIVQKVDKGLTAYCNAGSIYTDQKGDLKNMEVWLNTLVIANILSFTKLKKQYRISYNTNNTQGFI